VRLPRDLSGRELADALCRHRGYRQVHQIGSHIILDTNLPAHQTVRISTLNAIRRSVAEHKGVSRNALIDSL